MRTNSSVKLLFFLTLTPPLLLSLHPPSPSPLFSPHFSHLSSPPITSHHSISLPHSLLPSHHPPPPPLSPSPLTGVPGPLLITVNVTARSANLQWNAPASFIPITQYFVQFRREDDSTSMTEPSPSITSDPITITLLNLSPFTVYVVTVAAMNRAGNSTVTLIFTTLQDGQLIT